MTFDKYLIDNISNKKPIYNEKQTGDIGYFDYIFPCCKMNFEIKLPKFKSMKNRDILLRLKSKRFLTKSRNKK